jgi:DNA-binding NarL/FixJ family response regulator
MPSKDEPLPVSSGALRAAFTHRVLLVDDEPALLSALRRVVEEVRPDAIVVYASDAETAVWQMESTAIRLVLTDMSMQGDASAGWAVVNAARAAGVPVVVITGTTEGPELDRLNLAAIPLLAKRTLKTSQLAEFVKKAFAD